MVTGVVCFMREYLVLSRRKQGHSGILSSKVGERDGPAVAVIKSGVLIKGSSLKVYPLGKAGVIGMSTHSKHSYS